MSDEKFIPGPRSTAPASSFSMDYGHMCMDMTRSLFDALEELGKQMLEANVNVREMEIVDKGFDLTGNKTIHHVYMGSHLFAQIDSRSKAGEAISTFKLSGFGRKMLNNMDEWKPFDDNTQQKI